MSPAGGRLSSRVEIGSLTVASVCAFGFGGMSMMIGNLVSAGGALVPENRRDERQRLIDEQFAVIVRTREDQQRLRGRILGQLHDLAERFSRQGDTGDQGPVRAEGRNLGAFAR